MLPAFMHKNACRILMNNYMVVLVRRGVNRLLYSLEIVRTQRDQTADTSGLGGRHRFSDVCCPQAWNIPRI